MGSAGCCRPAWWSPAASRGTAARFARTWVLHAGAPASGHVTAVGFYGDRVQIGHGSAGGWDPFGPRRLVTRSKGNILYELDGKPALELYKQYLGERAEGLPATGLLFPLALSRGEPGRRARSAAWCGRSSRSTRRRSR